ncbi:hypothetical protein TSTA_106640, partial [Talaromyces stipitatus ATCC 10500]
WIGSSNFMLSRKLTNQLEERVLGLAALVAVSLIDIDLSPVVSLISKDSSVGLTGIREYRPSKIWQIFLGTLVTRYETYWELRSNVIHKRVGHTSKLATFPENALYIDSTQFNTSICRQFAIKIQKIQLNKRDES